MGVFLGGVGEMVGRKRLQCLGVCVCVAEGGIGVYVCVDWGAYVGVDVETGVCV